LTSDKNYVGFSTDPWNRLLQHNTTDQATYTAKYRPWKLVSVFFCPGNKSDAVQIERFIKKQKSKKLITKMTEPQFAPTGILEKLIRIPD
jgi:putative endonuclease